jgi:hypothetical protein
MFEYVYSGSVLITDIWEGRVCTKNRTIMTGSNVLSDTISGGQGAAYLPSTLGPTPLYHRSGHFVQNPAEDRAILWRSHEILSLNFHITPLLHSELNEFLKWKEICKTNTVKFRPHNFLI